MLNKEQEINCKKWAGYIEEQEGSRLSQNKWCEENQVNYNNFRYWRQRLKKEIAVICDESADESSKTNEALNSPVF